MIRLTKEQIILLRRDLVELTGGDMDIRDEGLLDSAVNAPFQTFDNEELSPTVYMKAARLAYGLVTNHPLLTAING